MLNLWESFIGAAPVGEPFVMFSRQHVNILITCAAVVVVGTWLVKRGGKAADTVARYSVAAFIIVMEILFQYWHIHIGDYSFGRDLPFDLCTISQIIIVVLLLKPNRYWSEIIFFWAFSGALQALLTPSFEFAYNFPHFRPWNYFGCHVAIIWAACYFAFVKGYRPHPGSVVRAFLWLNALALLVAFVNIATNGNYMFLCYKPAAGSLLDLFGPWPWYIIGTELTGLVMFAAIYLPFYLYDLSVKYQSGFKRVFK